MSDRDELYELFEVYIEQAASYLRQEDLPSVLVQKHEWGEEGHMTTGIEMRKHLEPVVAENQAFVGSEAAENLVSFVEEEYDWEPDYRYLQLVLVDVFGEEGQHLNDWEGRIEDAFKKFLEDVEEQVAKFRVKTFLDGINMGPSEIQITDDAVLREPSQEDRSYEENLQLPSHFDPTILTRCGAVLEFDVDNTSDYKAYPPGPVRRDMFLNLLRLYGRGSIPVLATTHDLRTFLGDRMGMGVPNTKRGGLPRISVLAEDGPRLQNLVKLLAPNYSKSDGAFRYPLSAAIDHFETSIEKRVYSRESITFAVIGLEALYTSGRGKVSTYCAFLLGSRSSYFDADEVQETLEEAYDSYRNSWAHGGSRERENTDVQHKLWDYLRSSIVMFTWLNRVGGLDKSARNHTVDRINRALIDEQARSDLLNEFETFALENYLQLPKRDTDQ